MNFFTDKQYLPYEGCPHTHFLFPLWGEIVEDIYHGQDIYRNYSKHFFEFYTPVSDLQSADFVVLPANIKQYIRAGKLDIVYNLIRLAKQVKIKLVIFFKDDSDAPLDFDPDATIIFRTSFYKSKQRKNEYAMPVWSGDLVNLSFDGVFQPSPKGPRMRMGFCGQTKPELNLIRHVWKQINFIRDIRRAENHSLPMMDFGKRWYSFLRHETLDTLQRSELFDCDFIKRPTYLGGSWISKGVFNLSQYEKAREVFLMNLKANDFFPCVRGGGNYSLRLFEVMSMGKIPIFVDTDSVIPFDDWIDWKEYFCWIDVDQLRKSPVKLQQIYLRTSDHDFFQWQVKNREGWREYLSPEGFFKNIRRYLAK